MIDERHRFIVHFLVIAVYKYSKNSFLVLFGSIQLRNLFFIVTVALASVSVQAQTYVEGHFRSDGSYVAPHYRTDANYTAGDNWSTKGNYNPYTGERGSKRCKATDPYCSSLSY